ncbi:hypothetical protein AGLY_001753 [Aphis glycines]|uniref:Uncharacterized protein n=1 Tax=Aphis glycines TaxID=307491 RepID=A0A6G0U4Q9_APHGL|nr:hypothetical protein AGLY_001753 [Aphis glycines]
METLPPQHPSKLKSPALPNLSLQNHGYVTDKAATRHNSSICMLHLLQLSENLVAVAISVHNHSIYLHHPMQILDVCQTCLVDKTLETLLLLHELPCLTPSGDSSPDPLFFVIYSSIGSPSLILDFNKFSRSWSSAYLANGFCISCRSDSYPFPHTAYFALCSFNISSFFFSSSFSFLRSRFLPVFLSRLIGISLSIESSSFKVDLFIC